MAKKYNPLVKMGFETVSQGGGGASLIELTYAQALAAMQGSTLTPGTLYKITDRGDRGLFFTAISSNKFAATGTRLMLCPADYSVEVDAYNNSWIGVWYSGLTPVVNDLAIWGGKVWKNLTGEVGTSDGDAALDVTNWVEITKTDFSNNEYVELVFGVGFDWENDWIFKQFDNRGNFLGIDYLIEEGYQFGFNLCDVSDWNMPYLYNNKCFGVYNNYSNGVYINDNVIQGTIKNNYCQSIYGNYCWEINNNIYNSIFENRCGGIISNNVTSDENGTIDGNSNTANIRDNNILGSISCNSNIGSIEYNTNQGHITFNKNSSYIMSNSNIGEISYNRNNGDISNNSSSGQCNISQNINNGGITGSWGSENISDPIVNKGY